MDANTNRDDRARLEQELLELHFGCHPEPDTLQARLEREPALRELQRRVLATAELLRSAALPAQSPLQLRAQPRGRWWRSPLRRVGYLAAAAGVCIAAFGAVHGANVWQLDRARSEQCRVTLSAPQAVPVGAPWSFTVESQDLDGNPLRSDLKWRATGADGRELANGTTTVIGRSVVAMSAGLAVPQRLDVTATHGSGAVTQSLEFVASATPPLVHVTTDKPVYRPGEPVFVRVVALDRCTLQPTLAADQMMASIVDAKGAPVFQQGGIALAGAGSSSVGACVWQVPVDSAGGEHTIEIRSGNGAFPTERVPFVVRAFAAPRLQKDIVLDRKTYAPGSTGSAEVTVARLGGGEAAGAMVRGSLVLDGDEVWTEGGVLDARGRAVFRFAVPGEVRQGAARFLARISDGGTVETEVRPFVVPTGEVLAAAFPEGGDLVAGVENRLYVELRDPLGRPIDGLGVVETSRGARVAEFVTAHQGRARCAFTPEVDVEYRVRVQGMKVPLTLPAPKYEGIALRMAGDIVAAGEPVRVRVAGRGDGPWLVGAFCRGVLLGQSTLRTEGNTIDRDVTIDVPVSAAGVLRVTVFDRALQPVAERLVQRAAQQRVQVAFEPERATLAPGEAQKVTVWARDETGAPLAGAAIGLVVTDGSALSMGTEPRIGLLDQLLLFADVERLEDLGQFLAGDQHEARNVDLLLGTRGWRRFVWTNDAVAKQAIAAAGPWAADQLQREGFAQRPQAVSNQAQAFAAVASRSQAAGASGRRFADAWRFAVVLLLSWLVLEALGRLPVPVVPRWVLPLGTAATVAVVMVVQQSRFDAMARLEVAAAMGDFAAPAGAPVRFKADAVALPEAANVVRRVNAADDDEKPGFFLGEDLGIVDLVQGDEAAKQLAVQMEIEPVAEQLKNRRDDAFAMGRVRRLQQAVREYAHRRTPGQQRADFTDTIFWHPLLVTDATGAATASFDTSDAVTTWHVRADAHGNGRVGQGEATFMAQLPFHVEAKLPVEVSAGDRLLVPIAVTRDGVTAGATAGVTAGAQLDLSASGPLSIEGLLRRDVALANGRGRELVSVLVTDAVGTGKLAIAGQSDRFRDRVEQSIAVVPRGFPHVRSWGGSVAVGQGSTFAVAVPAEALRGSGKLVLRVFPSPLAGMAQGLAGILQEPCGCFEQASSSNYPNVMVLSYLEACGDSVPTLAARAHDLLPRGYQKITGYECKERGFEWFGGDPGHEALTAYGLLQFHDMQKVYAVDAGMVQRTTAWLLARRDGKGGYLRNDRALDSFGRAPQSVTDAYVTHALLAAAVTPQELSVEIAAMAARANTTDDAYELALLGGALATAHHDGAGAALQRLATMQKDDGSLRGSTTSITSSGGDDLAVETTAWAVMAWLPVPEFAAKARNATEYLQSKKSARGTFGATQATICALRALSAYALQNRAMKAPGTLAVYAGDRKLAEQAFAAGQAEPVEFELWALLPPGEHALRLDLQSDAGVELPWAADLGYHSELPADDPDSAIAIATRLLADTVEEGRSVALEVMVANRRAEGQPMTLAIVGLPAGLDVPTRVLDDRKKAGDFDLWELRGRELVLYWRSLPPSALRRVQLDLVAVIPGTTTGPASRAYLYYTPAEKRWASPLGIEVTPAK